MAEALAGMKIERAFVMHGACGWDEATPFGPLQLFDVRPGSVRQFERDPAEHGVPRCRPSDLIGGDPFENARRLRAALEGEQGPHRDALELAAALALEVTGAAGTLGTGLRIAAAAIDDGSAARLLERLRTFSPTEAAVHV
jgi:anthranilate phosphoribosyltransferase